MIKLFEYKNNIYHYIEKEQHFTAIKFELHGLKNQEIHLFYGKGYHNFKEFSYSMNKFRKFQMDTPNKNLFIIFLKNLNHGYYFLQILSVMIWISYDYIYFSVIVLFLLFVLILLNSYLTYTFSLNMNFSTDDQGVIIRALAASNKINNQLSDLDFEKIIIPGDIIELSLGHVIPCDAILLDGKNILINRIL